jgi:orotidine-5'-phosphate decarboxylase
MVKTASKSEPKVFVALDLDSPAEAVAIAESLSGLGLGFKLGPRLMLREGAGLVQKIARHGSVFVDCKHFDIPSTMEAAIRTAFEAGAGYSTIHALSGPKALQLVAKVETDLNRERPFRILTVTILTSFDKDTLPVHLRGHEIGGLVEDLAQEARKEGLKSFVCSPLEAARLRKAIPDSYLVTPGIRPSGSSAGSSRDDQIRIETPASAAQAGASALVVGRPILEARDRREMALRILNEFSERV